MKLLDQREIQTNKSIILDEAKSRTEELRNEENKLALSVNIARDMTDQEISKINKEVEEHRKTKEIEKARLTQEVNKLSDERKRLLMPIDKIKKEAENILKKANVFLEEIKIKKENLAEDREKVQNMAEYNQDQRQILDEEYRKITEIKKNVKIEVLESKKSLDRASDEWAKISKAVNNLNLREKLLNNRQTEIETAEKLLQIKSEEQEKTRIRQHNKDKELKSNYTALEEAKKHLGIK